jgi:hypothetical protein
MFALSDLTGEREREVVGVAMGIMVSQLGNRRVNSGGGLLLPSQEEGNKVEERDG